MTVTYDIVVVGAGPNGLSAAIVAARAGASVLVMEANDFIGGGTHSSELTLPGFVHDTCSAIHPLAVLSPVFRDMPLEDHGLEFVHPHTPLAHPLDGGRSAALHRSVDDTANGLGKDGRAYKSLFGPFSKRADDLGRDLFGPLRLPHHPVLVARFGLKAIRSCRALARARFDDEPARALFAGLAAHSMLRLDRSPTAGIAMVLGYLGHAVGWPATKGGSGKIAAALHGHLLALGGIVETDARVSSMRDLPDSRAIIFDLTPRQIVAIAGDELPSRYRRALQRFPYGPGVFKLDWALDGPVPWIAEECRKAGTVHVGGTLDQISASEAEVASGRAPEKPYVLVAQQSLFDESRAPEGKHTLWAYCHVPSGCTVDMTERIESQIERFAPGFRDLILGRSIRFPADVERHNANCVGGDINGGVQDLRHQFTRPVVRLNPYTTPNERLFIGSSSTPPGGGVHGICGHFAARSALKQLGKSI